MFYARLPLSLAIAVSIVFVWMVCQLPITVLSNAVHDDLLFVRLGSYFAGLNWLGPYDNLTLIKGPIFPIWLGLSNILGLPFRFSEALLLVAAAAMLALSARHLIGGRWPALLLFIALLLNPVVFSGSEHRILRDVIYLPFMALILAGCLYWIKYEAASAGRRLLIAAALGFVLFCFWCTREEGIWVVPALTVGYLFFLLRQMLLGRSWRRLLRAEAPAMAMLLLVFFGGINLISYINYRAYGVYAVVEFKHPAFLSAYGALYRVEHDSNIDRIAVPKSTWQEIFDASPAAREIEPHVKGDVFKMWSGLACDAIISQHPNDGLVCTGEMLVGYLMFALRDAVTAAGYKTAPTVAEYYTRLGREIDAACDTGRLRCMAPRQTMMSPNVISTPSLLAAAQEIPRAISVGILLQHLSIMPRHKTAGPAAGIARFTNFLDAEAFPPSKLEQQAPADFPEDCYLAMNPDIKAAVERGQFKSGLEHYMIHGRNEGRKCSPVWHYATNGTDPMRPYSKTDEMRLSGVLDTFSAIGQAYRYILPAGLALGLLIAVAGCLRAAKRREISPELIICGIALAAVVSRILLISLLDVNGLAPINELYLGVISVPYILFVFIALVWGIKLLRSSRMSRA